MLSFENLESAIIRWTRMIAFIGLAGLVVLAFVVVVEVLSRWLLDFPVLGVYDFTGLAIRISVACCLPLVYSERRNITVRFVDNIVGPRLSNIFEGFGNLLSMFIFSLMAWNLLRFVDKLLDTREATWTVNILVGPWVAVATGLISLCIPVQALCFIMDIRSAFTMRKNDNQNSALHAGDKAKEENCRP